MAQETVYPDAVLVETNVTADTSPSVNSLTDDPGSPDGNWLNATSSNTDVVIRVSFPSPSGDLTTPATQTFRVLYRNNPTGKTADQLDIYLYENGSQVGSVLLSQSDPADSTVYSGTWDASSLSAISGVNVECHVVVTADTTPTPQIASGDIGAIAWDVEYDASSFNPAWAHNGTDITV